MQMNWFIDLILLIAGVYMIYSAWKLKTTGDIGGNTFWSTAYPLRKCKNLDGFVKYMVPRMIACGAILGVDGAAAMAVEQLKVFSAMPYISMGVTIFIMVWYFILTKKAERSFF